MRKGLGRIPDPCPWQLPRNSVVIIYLLLFKNPFQIEYKIIESKTLRCEKSRGLFQREKGLKLLPALRETLPGKSLNGAFLKARILRSVVPCPDSRDRRCVVSSLFRPPPTPLPQLCRGTCALGSHQRPPTRGCNFLIVWVPALLLIAPTPLPGGGNGPAYSVRIRIPLMF